MGKDGGWGEGRGAWLINIIINLVPLLVELGPTFGGTGLITLGPHWAHGANFGWNFGPLWVELG